MDPVSWGLHAIYGVEANSAALLFRALNRGMEEFQLAIYRIRLLLKGWMLSAAPPPARRADPGAAGDHRNPEARNLSP